MKVHVCLSAAICLLGAVLAQGADLPEPTAGHRKMLEWCGTYDITGKTLTTSLGPGRDIKGVWIGKPILNGFAVEGAYHFEGKGPAGATEAREIISYDPATETYQYVFLSNNGYREQAPFTVEGPVAAWEGTMVIDGQEVRFRGRDTDLPDGTGFVRTGEISTDGKTWQPNVECRYIKTKPTSDEQELVRLQHEWSRVEVAGDVGALDRLLADEYVLTLSDGTALPKAEYLRDVRSEDTRSTALAVENPTVRLYGDMALVKGIVKWTEPSGTKHEDLFHETWLKRDGRWQCLATQESELKPAMADSPVLSPEMKKLAALVGTWTYEGEQLDPPVAGLPYGGAGKYHGTSTERFILGGRFLESTIQDNNPSGKTTIFTITGYDPKAGHYVANAFISDGSRSASAETVSADGRTWTTRSTMTTSTGETVPIRSVMTLSPDGTRQRSVTEVSPDGGKTWKHWYKDESRKVQAD